MKAGKSVRLIVALSFSIWSVSCSAFVPWTQRIHIVASEPAAKIFVNGEYAGRGRVTTRVPRNENLSVMAKSDGYAPTVRNVGNKLSTTGILDIVGGCIILIPFVGLLFPGAHELEETNISLLMEKLPSAQGE